MTKKPKCPRAFSHRPGVYCKACDSIPKVKGE